MHHRGVVWAAIISSSLVFAIGACEGDPVSTPLGPSDQGDAKTGTSDGPGARSAPELVYDASREQVLMINGDAGNDSADAGGPAVLWALGGASWTKINEDGPPGRSLGAVAYDSLRGALVVAGGLVGDTAVSDTWEWDGTAWVDRGQPIPELVSNHLLAVYDEARGQTVIVFGQHPDLTLSSATFGWDGTQWRQLAATGPPPRAHYALGYDPEREVIVLFGGYDPAVGHDVGDTWEWDGEHWTAIDVPGPGPRAAARMTYDQSLGAMVLFGGGSGARRFFGDTWSWDGVTWRDLTIDGPPQRGYHGMAYDEDRSRVVLFGGYDGEDLGDTWELHDGRWSQVPG